MYAISENDRNYVANTLQWILEDDTLGLGEKLYSEDGELNDHTLEGWRIVNAIAILKRLPNVMRENVSQSDGTSENASDM